MEIYFWHLGHIEINGWIFGCSNTRVISEIKNAVLYIYCLIIPLKFYVIRYSYYSWVLTRVFNICALVSLWSIHNNFIDRIRRATLFSLKLSNDRSGMLKSFSAMKRYERWMISSTNLFFSICFNLFFPYPTFALAVCHNPNYYVILSRLAF